MQHAKIASFLSEHIGGPTSQLLALSLLSGQPMDTSIGGFPTQLGMRSRTHDLGLTPELSVNPSLPFNLKGISNLEESLMAETASGAMDEVLQLLRINEPLWIKSPTSGKYDLHSEHYEKLFPKANHFRSTTARVESSKDGCLATVKARELVEMFIDPVSYPNSINDLIYPKLLDIFMAI